MKSQIDWLPLREGSVRPTPGAHPRRDAGVGPLYERVVDVCEELRTLTLLTRERAGDLVDRYSERKPDRLKGVAADIGFVKR